MTGIKETKELLGFIIKVVEAVDKSLEDGKIGFMDMSNLVTAMLAANGAFNDINKVPEEIKDLTKEESEELYAYATKELSLNSAKTEEIVEKALEIGMKIYHLIVLFKDEPASVA